MGPATADGPTIGQAVDRIVRASPDGRLDRLVMVVRDPAGAGLALEGSPADRVPIRLRSPRS